MNRYEGVLSFQCTLDHAGAMLGPLLVFGLLQWGTTMEHVFMALLFREARSFDCLT